MFIVTIHEQSSGPNFFVKKSHWKHVSIPEIIISSCLLWKRWLPYYTPYSAAQPRMVVWIQRVLALIPPFPGPIFSPFHPSPPKRLLPASNTSSHHPVPGLSPVSKYELTCAGWCWGQVWYCQASTVVHAGPASSCIPKNVPYMFWQVYDTEPVQGWLHLLNHEFGSHW